MKLVDLIERIDQFDGRFAIYAARRWRASAQAVALREPDDGSLPAEATGKTFLLTVDEAKKVIERRRAARLDVPLTAQDKCAAVIYYAIYNECEPLPSPQSGEYPMAIAI